jgi:N-acetylmuramoyl-L-alanine amidase CwlA
MTINQNLLPSSKYSLKSPHTMTAEFICVHNTANDAPAKNEISYMVTNNLSTSFHFAVDDKEVWQGLPLNRNGWHAGDGANGTGNRKTIGIEICYSKSGGAKFTQAENLAAKLIAQLLKERGWGIDRVKKHQDFSGKNCPHRTLDMGWNRYLNLIKNYTDSGGQQDMMQLSIKDFERIRDNSEKWDGVHKELGLSGDPAKTHLDSALSVIRGYRSQATDMRNKLAVAEQEIKNRIEQVSRLEQRVLDEQQARKAEVAALSDANKAIIRLRGEYEARIESLEKQIDQAKKEYGRALNDLAVLEVENAQLKKGVKSTFTLWEWLIYPLPWLINKLKGVVIQ